MSGCYECDRSTAPREHCSRCGRHCNTVTYYTGPVPEWPSDSEMVSYSLLVAMCEHCAVHTCGWQRGERDDTGRD